MPKYISKQQIEDVCLFLHKHLKGKNYAIRGTASLVLQNLQMNVEDIDVICDEDCSNFINTVFKENIVKEVEFSESTKYKSFFGELIIINRKVEIMGNYQIKTKTGWGEVYDANPSQIVYVTLHNYTIPCTKISTEMKMYLEMGRFNAYHKIKNQLENFSQPTLFA